MKRKEIKNAFEEELKNINVSKELKEKTLNKISYKNNVYHLPYWIKNCAAIFVVTCICLSIYLANNKINLSKETKEENFINDITKDNTFGMPKKESINEFKAFMQKSVGPISDYADVEKSINNTSELRENSYIIMDSLTIAEESILTEEDFLTNNPSAIKTDNGYLLTENNETFLYVFENGLFLRKDIIK